MVIIGHYHNLFSKDPFQNSVAHRGGRECSGEASERLREEKALEGRGGSGRGGGGLVH